MRFVKGDRGASTPITLPTSAPNSGTDTGERTNSRNSGSRGRDDAGRVRGNEENRRRTCGAVAGVVNEVKTRREDAGEEEDVPVALLVVAEAILDETKAMSVSTLDVAEVTSGVGKLRTSLTMLLQEGLVLVL
ncbi:hypothetical protein PI125_g10677 [Phytophthora idaei]|nr:hypothetical protein PI125_g10677 [Phytophthora idaei]KAG3148676.1 hypothetical protein PI126_g12349 [Phytophthora idaei]